MITFNVFFNICLTAYKDLAIAENVDDLLIRLDEFEHLLDMVQVSFETERNFNSNVGIASARQTSAGGGGQSEAKNIFFNNKWMGTNFVRAHRV
jgi:hypothetical protein